MTRSCAGGCGRTLDTSELAGAAECCREDGYNSRGHRFGKFYEQLCCLCATKKGFDLTIANHGGCCQHCLQLNMKDLAASHQHLHLDSLCAKLASMIYDAANGGNSVRARLQGHFEILGENRLAGQQVMMMLLSFAPHVYLCAMAGLGPCELALVALPNSTRLASLQPCILLLRWSAAILCGSFCCQGVSGSLHPPALSIQLIFDLTAVPKSAESTMSHRGGRSALAETAPSFLHSPSSTTAVAAPVKRFYG